MVEIPFTPELQADLRVIQERQSEINKRVGRIEKLIEERLIDPARIAALEAEREEEEDSTREWVKFGLQTLFGIALTTLAVWMGSKWGITIAW